MPEKEDKFHVLHPKPEKTSSIFPNFTAPINPEEKRKPDAGPKGSRQETTEKVPIQIKRLQYYRGKWKNRQLKPLYVQWLCTDQCHFHCGHCNIRPLGLSLSDELTTRQMVKTLDTLSYLGCEIFSVIGGDPFAREDLFDILGYAKKKGMRISLTTHAYDLGKMLNKIEQAQFSSVMVSIDGYRSHHDQVRKRPGDYEQCLQCLDLFYDIDIPVIGASVTLMDETIHDVPKIINDVYDHGGNQIRIQPLLSSKKNSPQIIKQAIRQIYYSRLKGFIIEAGEGFGYLGYREILLRSSNFFCGWDTFTIMPDGKIMGCMALQSANHGEGNIKEDDLERIWFSGFNTFRKDIPDDLPHNCKTCRYLQICRGGCWLFRVYHQNPCFLPQAEEVLEQIIR